MKTYINNRDIAHFLYGLSVGGSTAVTFLDVDAATWFIVTVMCIILIIVGFVLLARNFKKQVQGVGQ